MIIAIDFDGTIVTKNFPGIGELLPNVKRTFEQLKKDGHIIIIWTCRKEAYITQATQFLKEKGIPFDFVNTSHPDVWGDSYPKIFADLYIDDKQLGGIP